MLKNIILILLTNLYASENITNLIIYYSQSGNSSKLAHTIHSKLSSPAKIVSIQANFPNTFSGKLKAAFIALFLAPTYIQEAERAKCKALNTISPTRTIILCAPIWMGAVCVPMQQFIASHQKELQNTQVFLCLTCGHSGAQTLDKAVEYINKRFNMQFKFWYASSNKQRVYIHGEQQLNKSHI